MNKLPDALGLINDFTTQSKALHHIQMCVFLRLEGHLLTVANTTFISCQFKTLLNI